MVNIKFSIDTLLWSIIMRTHMQYNILLWFSSQVAISRLHNTWVPKVYDAVWRTLYVLCALLSAVWWFYERGEYLKGVYVAICVNLAFATSRIGFIGGKSELTKLWISKYSSYWLVVLDLWPVTGSTARALLPRAIKPGIWQCGVFQVK